MMKYSHFQRYEIDIGAEDESMLPHIRSCMKGSIKKVSLEKWLDLTQLKIAAEMLKGVNITDIEIQFSRLTDNDALVI